ncbi:unnamed protein product [Cunninghamella blakesleeana]
MKKYIYWIVTLCIIIQLINKVESQIVIPTVSDKPPATTTPPPATSSNPPPATSSNPPPVTSSNPPPVTPTTTSFTPIITTTTTTTVPIRSTTTTTVPPSSTTPTSSDRSSSSGTSTSTSSSPTNKDNDRPQGDNGNTNVIVGAVVGGVVGLALIGGFLAWLNRRGGCTSKSNNRKERKADFEDFGLAERDFPHHRSPPVSKSTALAAGAVVGGGSALAANTMASPTIPRLNDQGNYYNDQIYMQQQQGGYDQYHDGGNYYYAQDGSAVNGGYYDENGYYYDNSTAVNSNMGYDPISPPQQNYHPNMMSNNSPLPPLPNTTNEVYKPDSIK